MGFFPTQSGQIATMTGQPGQPYQQGNAAQVANLPASLQGYFQQNALGNVQRGLYGQQTGGQPGATYQNAANALQGNAGAGGIDPAMRQAYRAARQQSMQAPDPSMFRNFEDPNAAMQNYMRRQQMNAQPGAQWQDPMTGLTRDQMLQDRPMSGPPYMGGNQPPPSKGGNPPPNPVMNPPIGGLSGPTPTPLSDARKQQLMGSYGNDPTMQRFLPGGSLFGGYAPMPGNASSYPGFQYSGTPPGAM